MDHSEPLYIYAFTCKVTDGTGTISVKVYGEIAEAIFAGIFFVAKTCTKNE